MQTILIIGSGLTGLTLAFQLKKQNKPFLVIEARNRYGGRIHTLKNTDQETPMEMGATWFGDKHTHLNRFLDSLGVERFNQLKSGQAWFESMSFVPPSTVFYSR